MTYFKKSLAIVFPVLVLFGFDSSPKDFQKNTDQILIGKTTALPDTVEPEKKSDGFCGYPNISFSKEGGTITTDNLPYELEETINTVPVPAHGNPYVDITVFIDNELESRGLNRLNLTADLSEGTHTILVRAVTHCNDRYENDEEKMQQFTIERASQ